MDILGFFGELLDALSAGFVSSAAAAADNLWNLLNSNFSAALLGAGAGAYSAQWIVERSDRKKRALEEVRATNAAINVAFDLINVFCALKSQHVTRLVQTYTKAKADAEADLMARSLGRPLRDGAFEFHADFQTLSMPQTLHEMLQHLLFEKVSVTGRPLIAFGTLLRTRHGLAEAFETRNRIAEECKAMGGVSHERTAMLYFGLENANGQTDARYPDTVRAIGSYTDDCIFFSKVLMEDLVRHGKKIRDELGARAPRIHEPVFSKAAASGLIPSEDQYRDWINAFKKSDAEVVVAPIDRWERFLGSSG